MGVNTKILTGLEAYFFGDDAQAHIKLIDTILACKKLEDFQALELELDSLEVSIIFENAVRVDNIHKELTKAKCRQVFNQLKSITTGADFI